MVTFKSFETVLSSINEANFDDIALSMFQFQAKQNSVYNDYLTHLGVNTDKIKTLRDIPFLPISFFKDQEVVTGTWTPQTTFLSSATTGLIPSKHRVYSLEMYLKNAMSIFENFYGSVSNFHFFALLPSYLEREGSSLVAMVNYFIHQSGSPYSSFYLNSTEELIENLSKAIKTDRTVILWGVTFALLDLAEKIELDLNKCIVMETGGMKGKREEITREAFHEFLCSRFNIKSVHSEYGMTELFSQAYAQSNGYFKTTSGMKVLVRDINDPFQPLNKGKTGGLNVIDLSNIYTCAFVETQDLGKVLQDGSFEVLGRIDNSDMRGCNLLVG